MDKLKRNHLLLMSDWTQLPDSPLSAEKREEWRIYRQQLRNLPDNNWNWPIPPTSDDQIPITKL